MPREFIFHKENKTIDGVTFANVTVNWKQLVERMLLELPDGQVKIQVVSAQQVVASELLPFGLLG